MNRVYSTKEPMILNGEYMKPGDFGIIRKTTPPAKLKEGQHVMKGINFLICLQNGLESARPNLYEIELKDNLNLQRIK